MTQKGRQGFVEAVERELKSVQLGDSIENLMNKNKDSGLGAKSYQDLRNLIMRKIL